MQLAELIVKPHTHAPLISKEDPEVIARSMITSFMYNMTSISTTEYSKFMRDTRHNLNPKLVKEVTEQVKMLLLDSTI